MKLGREQEGVISVKFYTGNKDIPRGIFGLDKYKETELNDLGYLLVVDVIDNRIEISDGYEKTEGKAVLKTISKDLVLADVISEKIASLNVYYQDKISTVVFPYVERKTFESSYVIPSVITNQRDDFVNTCHSHETSITQLTIIIDVLDYNYE